MIEKLKEMGLSSYEAKSYLTLLLHGSLSGTEIAKISGVPPTSVYRNLESLQRIGFIRLLQKDPFVFCAIDPHIAIPSFSKTQKQKMDELSKTTIQQLQEMKKTQPTPKNIKKQENIWEVYSGRQQSYKLCKELISSSHKEMLLIGGGEKQSLLDIIHDLKKAVARRVECKFIVTTANSCNIIIEEMKKSGIKIRHAPVHGISLIIKDRGVSQMVIKDRVLKEERIALKITNNDFAKVHAEYFDGLWKKARTI